MNGYMWFYSARAHGVSSRARSHAVRQHRKRETRTSRRVTALALLLLLATVVITHAAMTG
jgi:hypothetical protein